MQKIKSVVIVAILSAVGCPRPEKKLFTINAIAKNLGRSPKGDGVFMFIDEILEP